MRHAGKLDPDAKLESDRRLNNWPHWPDARGWIGIGAFILTIMVLWMAKADNELRHDEFFKVLATLIVGAFVRDVMGWAFAATKGGGELADKNAALVADTATAAAAALVETTNGQGKPKEVTIVNPDSDPIPTAPQPAAPVPHATQEDLPDYARG
jgi:hypothetical protein